MREFILCLLVPVGSVACLVVIGLLYLRDRRRAKSEAFCVWRVSKTDVENLAVTYDTSCGMEVKVTMPATILSRPDPCCVCGHPVEVVIK